MYDLFEMELTMKLLKRGVVGWLGRYRYRWVAKGIRTPELPIRFL